MHRKRILALIAAVVVLAGISGNVMAGFPCIVPGDMDNNFVVNTADIPLFVNALLSGADNDCADVNHDGFVDGRDVQPFVQLLL